jgi:transcriptional regulator with XRE-family HTH domain
MTADQFKASLIRLGWSQADFADRAGLTRPTVSRWATGDVAPPPWAAAWLETLLDLAALRDKYLSKPVPTPTTE